MGMPAMHDSYAHYFNLGSDARISGKSRDAYPDERPDHWSSLFWKQGWDDVDTHWGDLSRKLGLPVAPLPEVK